MVITRTVATSCHFATTARDVRTLGAEGVNVSETVQLAGHAAEPFFPASVKPNAIHEATIP